tara:strand:- start:10983 stop:11099 length:117 start_codon:yes stop_codon:yes gene_type:complete
MFTRIKDFILYPWTEYKRKKALKEKLKKLREKDPYIYE